MNVAIKTELNRTLTEIVENLDIPPSYYETAIQRYNSIGEWLHRPESIVSAFEPTIFPQGSFRLGLVNKPVAAKEEYDLDLVCLLKNLSKAQLTQKRLKEMVGTELTAYRDANNIIEPLRERKRCWRLDYADKISFHIDTLPCVPEDKAVIEQLCFGGVERKFAIHAIAITCNTSPIYSILNTAWPMSNPAGYGMWFEERMGIHAALRRAQLVSERIYRTIEEVPAYALKTPLQFCIQLLKRHRDWMFRSAFDLRPISMIITTLAAHAYQGETDLADAMDGIIRRLPEFIFNTTPRIPNPVNPGEDFADKWSQNDLLERNFWSWYEQAKADFGQIISDGNFERASKIIDTKLGVRIPKTSSSGGSSAQSRKSPSIIVSGAPRPWREDG